MSLTTKYILIAIGLILVAHPVVWTAKFTMIGMDTCSRNGPAPMLIECVPGISEPEVWQACTGREMGFAIAEAREWRTRAVDCRTSHILSGINLWSDEAETSEEVADEPVETHSTAD